ncbi:WW domain-containing protein [Artemisia annua]|uniref:Trimethylguanosine synthase n=1 Tax=Artemisia annua TaxID=35608 RepID=A0A2U1NTJ1_ARTAN|nr:WW domain-containing protein [Artemisia annua]
MHILIALADISQTVSWKKLPNCSASGLMKQLHATEVGVSFSHEQSVGENLKDLLFKMIQQLQKLIPHFINCIKPTTKQLPGTYEKDAVLEQLRGNRIMKKKNVWSEVKETCRPEELNNADESDWINLWGKNSEKYEYYNQIRQESTWEPLMGKGNSSLLELAGPELTADSVDRSEDRRLSVGNIEHIEDVLLEDYFLKIRKYWGQKYLLFSKYNEGIQMDEEGWFSATPECIAEHHADRCGGGIVVDCFTGVGGNAIRFAPKTSHVIAIDIDPKKIKCAQKNANVYGVKDHIEFIIGDSFILAPKLKADTIFLSPPWGGPDYNETKIFDINTMLKPHSGKHLFNVAKKVAPRVVMYLPKNSDIGQLADLALSTRPPWKLEVEKNVLNGKLKAITAYFTKPLAHLISYAAGTGVFRGVLFVAVIIEHLILICVCMLEHGLNETCFWFWVESNIAKSKGNLLIKLVGYMELK